MRCLVLGCEIKEQGGCYCCCRLIDHINGLKRTIEGYTLGNGCCYFPTLEGRQLALRCMSSERQFEEELYRNEIAPKQLKRYEKILKDKYEVDEV